MKFKYLVRLCDDLCALSGKKINHEVHKVLSQRNTKEKYD